MPDVLIERRFPRYAIQVPLLHKTGAPQKNPLGIAWTRNLSEGGACVELARSLEPQMQLVLRLQTDRGPIAAGANVVWVGDPDRPGGSVPHGVAFTLLASDQHQALRSLVARGKDQQRADVRLSFEVSVACHHVGPPPRPPIEGLTGDISRGGLLLLLPLLLPSGTLLELGLQTVRGELGAKGEIAWAESPTGQPLGPPFRHGFRFTAIGWSTLLNLGILLMLPR
jgi:PilZ domain-containing protein